MGIGVDRRLYILAGRQKLGCGGRFSIGLDRKIGFIISSETSRVGLLAGITSGRSSAALAGKRASFAVSTRGTVSAAHKRIDSAWVDGTTKIARAIARQKKGTWRVSPIFVVLRLPSSARRGVPSSPVGFDGSQWDTLHRGHSPAMEHPGLDTI